MDRIRFGAIDIGSNAIRLLIMSVSPERGNESFNKELMLRVPIRLGLESFESGKISEKKKKNLIKVMKAFKHLLSVFEVDEYRACATAAMREAKNRKEITKCIKEETGLKIEVIDGQEEAIIIYDSHFLYNLNDQQNYLFVDVGGGSTEISLISNGELIQSTSYQIGTVRSLLNKVEDSEHDRLHSDMELLKSMYEIKNIIASGGNIIKLNTLANIRKDRNLNINNLETINNKLKELSVEERIETYKLKADRADVITIAGDIYLDVAKSINAKSFIVPRTGLIDGIIHLQFEKWKSKKNKKDSKKSNIDQQIEDDNTQEMSSENTSPEIENNL